MSLRKQATSLTFMHAADVLQPLVLLPYAGRVLEPLHFGQFVYAMSIGQLASTLVEYGFHWTAQRAAASARHDPAVIASLFAEVVATKAILFLVVTVAGLAVSDQLLSISKPMFLSAMLTSAGLIFFPAWLFIALERAWQAAVAVIVARIMALVCFLTMVTSPHQLVLAVAIQASVPLAAGALSLPFIAPIGFAGFRLLTLSRVAMQLRNGWRGFLFTLVERAIITLPVPIVAHFGGYVAAGQYSVADKFVSATRPFFRIVSETFLPRVAYYAQHSPAAGVALIWNSLSTLIIGAALSLLLFFLAPYFIIFLFGEGFAGAIPIIRIMAVIPLLVNVNISTSNLYMFNFGHERAWVVLTVSSLLMFLTLASVLPRYLASASIAVAVAIIARECFVFVVSSGFFLVSGTAKMRASLIRGSDVQETGIATDLMLSPAPRTAPPRRDRLSSEW